MTGRKPGVNDGKNKTEVEQVEQEIENLEDRSVRYDPHRNEPGQKSYDKKNKHLEEPTKDHVWGFRPSKHGEAAEAKKKEAQAEQHKHSHHANHNEINIPGFKVEKKN